jgi:septal ring factor EnvC (AmiA/AmiB activator)
MARRAKLAAVASAVETPAPRRPSGGYDDRTVAEAAAILRHQTNVLAIRARVAAAARGLGAPEAGLASLVALPVAAAPQLDEATATLHAASERLERLMQELAERHADDARNGTRASELEHEAEALRATAEAAAQAVRDDAAALASRERDVAHLEQVLADRSAELDAAKAKLAAQALAAGDAAESLAARSDKLEAAEAHAAADRKRHVAELDGRTRKLEKERQELARAAARLDERERSLKADAAAVAARNDELRRAEKNMRRDAAAAERQLRELEGGTRELAGRLEAVAARELDAASRTAELDERERALAAREHALDDAHAKLRETVLDPEPEREAAPADAPAAPAPTAIPTAAAPPATFNVGTLASLVDRHAETFPEHVEEWRWYLSSLRDVADIGGHLPASVNGLVHEVFGPLLAHA